MIDPSFTSVEDCRPLNPQPKEQFEVQISSSDQQRVYFAISDQEVKIGLAKDQAKRLANMRVVRPNIRFLGDIPGDRKTEKDLQQRFSEDRIAGEWFRFTPKVEAAIKDLLRRRNVRIHPPLIERIEPCQPLVPEWLRIRDVADRSGTPRALPDSKPQLFTKEELCDLVPCSLTSCRTK